MGIEFKNVDHSRFAKEPRLYFAENKDRSAAKPYKYYCDPAKKGTDFSCLAVVTTTSPDSKTNKVVHYTIEEINRGELAEAYNNWLAAHWSITKGDGAAAALKHYRLKLPLTPTKAFLAVEQVIVKNKTEALAFCVALAARNSKPYSMALHSIYNSHQSEIQQTLHNNEVAARAKALQAEKTAQAVEEVKSGGVAVLRSNPIKHEQLPSQHEEDRWMPTRPRAEISNPTPAPKPTPEKSVAIFPFFSLFIPGNSRRGQEMKLPNTFTKEQSDAIRRFIGDSLVTSRLQSIVVVTENNPQGKVIGAHTMEGINQHALAMPFNNFVASTKTLAWMAGYMSKLALAASTNPAIKTGAYQTSPVEQKLANSPEHAYTFYTALEKAGFPWQPWNTAVIIAAERHKVNVIKKKEQELRSTKNKIFWLNLLPFITGVALFVPMLAYFIKTRNLAMGGFSLFPLALMFGSIACFITESKKANKAT